MLNYSKQRKHLEKHVCGFDYWAMSKLHLYAGFLILWCISRFKSEWVFGEVVRLVIYPWCDWWSSTGKSQARTNPRRPQSHHHHPVHSNFICSSLFYQSHVFDTNNWRSSQERFFCRETSITVIELEIGRLKSDYAEASLARRTSSVHSNKVRVSRRIRKVSI